MAASGMLCGLMLTPAVAQESLDDADFSELSLDALLDIPVTTVSRKIESLRRAAAAIYVIQGDELRRLGIHTLPEALRLAPGLHVAQISAQDYGITARGMNRGQASNKLEVLVDGRSIYTPLFSGVLWDQQFALIEDIERIEVIRGSDGTLGGANAVNGVINIVTRAATDGAGGYAQAAGGTATRHFAAVRQSATWGESGAVRFYAQDFALGDSMRADGSDARDGQRATQGGFRSDFELAAGNYLTLQGDVFDTRQQEGSSDDTVVSGGNVLGRWTLVEAAAQREWELQGYVDQYERDTPGVFGEQRLTLDATAQYRQLWGDRHDVVLRLSYRNSADETAPDRVVIFQPADRTLTTVGALVYDEITLIPDRWTVALGAKYEHNDLSGDELQPSARTSYALTPASTLWAAASRAVRTPNRVDHDLAFDTGQADELGETPFSEVPEAPRPSRQCQALPQNPLCPLIRSVINTVFPPAPSGIVKVGNPDFESEEVLAYELGYRSSLTDTLSLDTAVFFNQYEKLQSIESNDRVGNGIEGSTRGLELLLLWQAAESTRVHFDVTHLRTELEKKSGSTDTTTVASEGNDPRYYGSVRISHQPAAAFNIETGARYVAALPNLGVPAYTSVHLSLAWAPQPWMALRLTGNNLLDSGHREFEGNIIERALLGQLELRWP